jgi:hypothetical protein
MNTSIKIVNGPKGYILTVDGMYINFSFSSDNPPVRAIRNELGIPYGSTEWVSIEAVRRFWNNYRQIIVSSTQRPYKSVWGQLILINA